MLYVFSFTCYKNMVHWLKKEVKQFIAAISDSWRMLKLTLSVLSKNQQILLYPVTSLAILLATLPAVNVIIYSLVIGLERIVNPSGLTSWTSSPYFNYSVVIVSLIYGATVSSFFSCLTAASVTNRLENHPTSYGRSFRIVRHHYLRIIRFGVVSPIFSFIYLLSNHPKSLRRLVEVVPPAISINTALLAPSILSTNMNVRDTMKDATNTLGKGWRQQVVFKALLLALIILLLSISFLPGEVGRATEHSIGEASHTVEVLIKFTLALSLFIASRVLGSVFTAVLYYNMKYNKK